MFFRTKQIVLFDLQFNRDKKRKYPELLPVSGSTEYFHFIKASRSGKITKIGVNTQILTKSVKRF